MYDLPDETCREQKFALLQRALGPSMAPVIRLGALQSLADFNDPRVPAVLQSLAADRDPILRQHAAELLQEQAR